MVGGVEKVVNRGGLAAKKNRDSGYYSGKALGKRV